MSLFHSCKFDIQDGNTLYCKCGKYRSVNSASMLGYETRTPQKEREPTPAEIQAEKERQARSREHADAFIEASEINHRNFMLGYATFYTADDILKKKNIKQYESSPPTLIIPVQTETLAERILRLEKEQHDRDYQEWLRDAG